MSKYDAAVVRAFNHGWEIRYESPGWTVMMLRRAWRTYHIRVYRLCGDMERA